MAALPSAIRITTVKLQPTTRRAITRNEQQGTPNSTIARDTLAINNFNIVWQPFSVQ
jgi:hypothetical protein